jgi:hypothetical protein
VTRRIADDEFARRRREVTVCDVDRDALFALGQESVGDERKSIGICPARRDPASSAVTWSDSRPLLSQSRRPISVLLPSSTLPAVVKRKGVAA